MGRTTDKRRSVGDLLVQERVAHGLAHVRYTHDRSSNAREQHRRAHALGERGEVVEVSVLRAQHHRALRLKPAGDKVERLDLVSEVINELWVSPVVYSKILAFHFRDWPFY